MYQSKDGKPLNRLMASRGAKLQADLWLALVHEVGASPFSGTGLFVVYLWGFPPLVYGDEI